MFLAFFKLLALAFILFFGWLSVAGLQRWTKRPRPTPDLGSRLAYVGAGLPWLGLVLLAFWGLGQWFGAWVAPFVLKPPEVVLITMRSVNHQGAFARVWADGHIIWGDEASASYREGYLTDAQLSNLLQQGEFPLDSGSVSASDVPQAIITVVTLTGEYSCSVRVPRGGANCLAVYGLLQSGAGATSTPYVGATRFVEAYPAAGRCANVFDWSSAETGFSLAEAVGRGAWAKDQAAQALVKLRLQMHFGDCVQESGQRYTLALFPPEPHP